MTDVLTGTCANCGAPNLGTKFCESCGTPAGIAVAAPSDFLAIFAASPVALVISRFGSWALLSALLLSYVVPEAILLNENGDNYQTVDLAGGVAATVLRLVVFIIAVGLALTGTLTTSRRVGALVLAVVYLVVAVFVSPDYYFFFGAGSLLALIPIFFGFTLSRNYRPLANVAACIGFVISIGLTVFVGFTFDYHGVYWVDLLVPVITVLSTVAIARAFQRRPISPPGAPVAYTPQYVQLANGQQGMVQPQQGTNVLAVVAMVLGILGGNVLPIIFGHVALSQVRRTGEKGEGMAITGLTLGYFWTLLEIVVLIVVAVVHR